MENKIFKPIGDRVLVEEYKTKEERKSAGGIIIPETVTADDIKMGKVIATGPGIYTQNGALIPMTLKVGDEVAIPPYGNAQVLKLNSKTYYLYRETELLGTFEVDSQLEMNL
jgi:chaperonin GroES